MSKWVYLFPFTGDCYNTIKAEDLGWDSTNKWYTLKLSQRGSTTGNYLLMHVFAATYSKQEESYVTKTISDNYAWISYRFQNIGTNNNMRFNILYENHGMVLDSTIKLYRLAGDSTSVTTWSSVYSKFPNTYKKSLEEDNKDDFTGFVLGNSYSGKSPDWVAKLANCYNVTYTSIQSDYYSAPDIETRAIYLCTSLDNLKDGSAVTPTPTPTYTITQNLTNCTSNFNKTSVEENTQISITLAPNSNYEFTTVPTLNNGTSTTNFTKNSDGTYSITTTVTSNITITANATAIPVIEYVSANYVLTDATCNRTEPQFEKGSQITFIVTANENYKFDDTIPPKYQFSDNVTHNFIKLSDTQYTSSIELTDDVTIIANAIENLKNFFITQNLTNCTSDLTDKTIKEKTEKTVTLSLANSDYVWTETPTITIGAQTFNFVLNEETNTYSYTFTATGNITINASAEIESFDVNFSLTNCTSNYSGGTATKGSSYTFQLTANEGFEFKTAPYITDGTTVTNFEYNEKENFYYCNYTVNSTITIVGKAEEITEISQILSYVNIYTVSNSNLEILANERILREVVSSSGSSGSIGNVQTVYVDTGEYVLVLQAEYIPIHTIGSDYIRYGGYQSKAIGNLPETNVVTIDCGTIDITEIHNNILDYTPYSIMILSLPFIGDVTLDNDLFMNGSMNITYIINILNGAVTCNVKNTKTGYVTTYTGYCNYNIPIKYNNQLGYKEFISLNQSVNSSNILALDSPYLTIFTETPIDENRVYGTTDKTDTGENLKGGYIEADIIDLYISESETDTEQNEILTLFRQGVYLNE